MNNAGPRIRQALFQCNIAHPEAQDLVGVAPTMSKFVPRLGHQVVEAREVQLYTVVKQRYNDTNVVR